MKRAPAARGGQDAGVTQPREHSFAYPCTLLDAPMQCNMQLSTCHVIPTATTKLNDRSLFHSLRSYLRRWLTGYLVDIGSRGRSERARGPGPPAFFPSPSLHLPNDSRLACAKSPEFYMLDFRYFESEQAYDPHFKGYKVIMGPKWNEVCTIA